MKKVFKKIINLSALILLIFFLFGSALILLNILTPETYSQIRNNLVVSPICNVVETITERTDTVLTAFSSAETDNTKAVYASGIKVGQKDEETDKTEKQVLTKTIEEENPEEYWAEEISLLKQYVVNPSYDFTNYDFLSEVEYHGTPLNFSALTSDGWIPATSAESYKIMLENTEQKYGGAAYLYVSDCSSEKITSADLESNGIAEIDVNFSCPLSFHGIGVGNTAEELFTEFGRPYFCQIMCTGCEEEPTAWWVYRAEEDNAYIIVEFVIDADGAVFEIHYSSGKLS